MHEKSRGAVLRATGPARGEQERGHSAEGVTELGRSVRRGLNGHLTVTQEATQCDEQKKDPNGRRARPEQRQSDPERQHVPTAAPIRRPQRRFYQTEHRDAKQEDVSGGAEDFEPAASRQGCPRQGKQGVPGGSRTATGQQEARAAEATCALATTKPAGASAQASDRPKTIRNLQAQSKLPCQLRLPPTGQL